MLQCPIAELHGRHIYLWAISLEQTLIQQYCFICICLRNPLAHMFILHEAELMHWYQDPT